MGDGRGRGRRHAGGAKPRSPPLGVAPSLTLARAGPRRGHGLPPCVLMPAPQPRRVCGSAAGPSRCPGAHLDEIPNSPPEVLGAGHPVTCAPGAQEMSLLSLLSERDSFPQRSHPAGGTHSFRTFPRGRNWETLRPQGTERGGCLDRSGKNSRRTVILPLGTQALRGDTAGLCGRRSGAQASQRLHAKGPGHPPPTPATPPLSPATLSPGCCAGRPAGQSTGSDRAGWGTGVPHSRGLWVALSGLPEVSRGGGRLWNDGQLGWNLADFLWPQCWSEE